MAQQHPMVGRVLGNYILRSVLGQGGMGAVFLGEHKFLGDKVAVKVLHGSYANNASVTQRFFVEAKASREINHPNVVKIVDFGQSADGGLYLVMELLEGHSLSAQLRAGPLPEPSAAYVAAAVADALAAAHAKQIVHRDLKPDNVFLAGNTVKVVDFGVAKVLSASAQTGTGLFLGTPRYMAPEQARGARFVGPHSDVYQLGLLMYRMVVGRLPFEADDPAELINLHMRVTPPRPSEFGEISVEFEELIMHCLEKLPAGRPNSMTVVRDRLLRWAKLGKLPKPPPEEPPPPEPSIPDHFRPPSGSISMATIDGGSGEVMRRMEDERPPVRRSSGIALPLVIIMVLLGGGGFAALKIFSHPAATTTPTPDPAPPTAATPPPPKPPEPAPTVTPLPTPAPAPVPPVAAPTVTPVPVDPAPGVAKVVLNTNPPGASIEINGKRSGVTPAELTLKLPQLVVLRLDGFKTAREVLGAPGEATIKLQPEHHSHHDHDTPLTLPKPPQTPEPSGEGLE